MKNLQYKVARGAMEMLAQAGRAGFLALVGISQDDFNVATGDTPWIGSQRNRVVQTLKSMMFLTTDNLGFPRFRLPAEYVAGAISIWVSPVNCHSACHSLAYTPSAQDLASGKGTQQLDECTPEQLFALCVQLYADPVSSSARALFESKTSLNIDRAILQQEVIN